LKRLYRPLGYTAVLIVTALFVWYVMRSLRGHDLSAYATPRAALGIVLAAILWSCGVPLLAIAWRGMLASVDVRKPLRELFAILGITQFAKYVPGNVAQYVGRVGMSLARGIPARPLAVTLILETLLIIAAAAATCATAGALSNIGLDALRAHGRQLALVTALVVFVIIGLLTLRLAAPAFLRRFAPKYAPALEGTQLPAQSSLALAFILYCAVYFCTGVGLILLAGLLLPEAPHDYWLLVAIFALAWVVGFVTPGAPGGLGVREALMVLMLAPLYTAASASVLVIAFRIATTLGDALTLVVGLAMLPRTLKTPSASSGLAP
jgi:glycosyltransferase 2 family protein